MSDRPASEVERAEELRNRYPDVIRVAAGLAVRYVPGQDAADDPPPSWDGFADWCAEGALAIVIACERVCGIGGDA